MVYIKLSNNLYNRLKGYVEPNNMVLCQKEHYLPYPQFKRIAFNHNLQIHKQIGRHDIITYSEMQVLKERQKQTPEQLRFIQQLKNKSEMRKLKLINPKSSYDYYFQKKAEGNGMKEMTQSISYSMAFIFSFFMAGLTGYYIGSYFLGWSLSYSLMIALAFIVVTIFLETSLFILRQSKNSLKSKTSNNPEMASKFKGQRPRRAQKPKSNDIKKKAQ